FNSHHRPAMQFLDNTRRRMICDQGVDSLVALSCHPRGWRHPHEPVAMAGTVVNRRLEHKYDGLDAAGHHVRYTAPCLYGYHHVDVVRRPHDGDAAVDAVQLGHESTDESPVLVGAPPTRSPRPAATARPNHLVERPR